MCVRVCVCVCMCACVCVCVCAHRCMHVNIQFQACIILSVIIVDWCYNLFSNLGNKTKPGPYNKIERFPFLKTKEKNWIFGKKTKLQQNKNSKQNAAFLICIECHCCDDTLSITLCYALVYMNIIWHLSSDPGYSLFQWYFFILWVTISDSDIW